MVRTTELEKIAEIEGIIIESNEFVPPFKGIYIRDKDMTVIGLDTRLTPIEKRCVLAEELGHHFTMPNGMDLRESHRYGILEKRVRYETQAREYAALLLMPKHQWLRAINKKDVTVEELMTTFAVTREMVLYRLDIYFNGHIWINEKCHMQDIDSKRLYDEQKLLRESKDLKEIDNEQQKQAQIA